MAFKAKDGKNFGNRQQMKAYDERKPSKKSDPEGHEAAESPEFEAGEQEGMHEVHEQEETGTPIEEHVAQHGPAHKVEVHHDHEGGRHTKVSHHGGAKHVSHHGSAEEAHHAGMVAAGAGAPEQEPEPMQEPAGIPGM